jgi:putative addiction module component (TIGR02574 family)
MSISVESIEAQALVLSASDRARLIERLISSLDIDPEVEEIWAVEVERRFADFEKGNITLLSGPDSLESLKNEFR